MSMFTLAISCLTTSSLPWFMDLTFQVPMQYCSSQHWTLLPSPITSTTGCCFFLWLHPFMFSGVISPLISSSMLGTYWPGEFIFQCPIFLPFHTVHGVLKARILKWFAIPFSSGPHSVRRLYQFLWKRKRPQIAKAVLRKKNGKFFEVSSQSSHWASHRQLL